MTGGQIETFLYEKVTALLEADAEKTKPMINPSLSGKVYYRGTRPMQQEQGGTDKEDVVVACIAGNDNQVQSGSCVVNVYIPDILVSSGARYKDKARTDMVAEWLQTVPHALTAFGGIYFKRSSMILAIEEEDIHQHFVSLKMDFKLLNESYE